MSGDFSKLVTDLQSDYSLAIDFLDNPADFLKNYNLDEIEYWALSTSDYSLLAELCGSEQVAAGALSGAHSSQCTKTTPIIKWIENTDIKFHFSGLQSIIYFQVPRIILKMR